MKIVLVYSGGLDSTVLLWDLIQAGHEVQTLSFNYGQRHGEQELHRASLLVGEKAQVPHTTCDAPGLGALLGGSALTDPDIQVPDGHYEEESMKDTVVPNRNMIFLSIAAGFAVSIKAEAIAFAAHAGDHAIYPDCRPSFVHHMEATLHASIGHQLKIMAPYIHFAKSEIVTKGMRFKVPFEQTWSCYKGGEIHCGTCGTCVERREAFDLAKVKDPTEYEVS